MSALGIVIRRTGTIGAFLCWFSSSVVADPVRLTSLRLVDGRVTGETNTLEFGDFEASGSQDSSLLGPVNLMATAVTPPEGYELPQLASFTATQDTDVSATRWSGSGTVQTDVIPASSDSGFSGSATAQSIMFVEFTLAAPMAYQLTGTLTGEFAAITLNGPTTLGWTLLNGGAVPLVAMRRGLLSPGDYLFDARAFSGISSGGRTSGRSAFDVQFSLSNPVPEPATFLLFSTGAAFVGRTGWRRRREQSGTGGPDSTEEG